MFAGVIFPLTIVTLFTAVASLIDCFMNKTREHRSLLHYYISCRLVTVVNMERNRDKQTVQENVICPSF